MFTEQHWSRLQQRSVRSHQLPTSTADCQCPPHSRCSCAVVASYCDGSTCVARILPGVRHGTQHTHHRQLLRESRVSLSQPRNTCCFTPLRLHAVPPHSQRTLALWEACALVASVCGCSRSMWVPPSQRERRCHLGPAPLSCAAQASLLPHRCSLKAKRHAPWLLMALSPASLAP